MWTEAREYRSFFRPFEAWKQLNCSLNGAARFSVAVLSSDSAEPAHEEGRKAKHNSKILPQLDRREKQKPQQQTTGQNAEALKGRSPPIAPHQPPPPPRPMAWQRRCSGFVFARPSCGPESGC